MSNVEVQEMLALFPVLLCTGYTDSSKYIYIYNKREIALPLIGALITFKCR